jgi:hypothetical protein
MAKESAFAKQASSAADGLKKTGDADSPEVSRVFRQIESDPEM